jgi:hypothetical protein
MYKRLLAISILGIALLFSQGGNVLIAALCPHLQPTKASCHKQVSDREMSHERFGHQGMESMDHEAVPNPNPDPNTLALEQPTAPCSHCALHSRNDANTSFQLKSEASKRSGEIGTPVRYSILTPVIVSPIAVLVSRAHGPPGERISRHILNNVFLI